MEYAKKCPQREVPIRSLIPEISLLDDAEEKIIKVLISKGH